MTAEYRTVVGLKPQLSKSSGIISNSFRKPKKKLIKEMIYGIQASKDVKLSNISRTVKEEQFLIKGVVVKRTDKWRCKMAKGP